MCFKRDQQNFNTVGSRNSHNSLFVFDLNKEFPGDSPQYGREKSNKSLEDGDKKIAALKSTLQRFRIYFFQNPSFKGVESTS